MKKTEMYLITGVLIGGILWGSINTLLENNGIVAILGLATACLLLGVGLGMTIGEGKHE